MWPHVRPEVTKPQLRVALFAGCLQDFVYPEQLRACVDVLEAQRVAVDFPMEQSCCGLPLQMMGDRQVARAVAEQNLRAFVAGEPHDYIVTLCASCASHLKYGYAKLLADEPRLAAMAAALSRQIIDFSSLAHDVLQLQGESSQRRGEQAAYHAPCHLCRGLGVRQAPRQLIETAGLSYVVSQEEEVCCGFGGTYSLRFPELSNELLNKKLEHVEASGARLLLSDCPGCIMQLRGGLKRRGSQMMVQHIAEALAKASRQT